MHLNGKVVLGVDELYQNREILEALAVLAENALALFSNVLGEGLAVELAADYNALTVLVAGELPALGDPVGIQLLAVFLAESVASPDIVLARCFQL